MQTQTKLEQFGFKYTFPNIPKNKLPKTNQLTLTEINIIASIRLKKFVGDRINVR